MITGIKYASFSVLKHWNRTSSKTKLATCSWKYLLLKGKTETNQNSWLDSSNQFAQEKFPLLHLHFLPSKAIMPWTPSKPSQCSGLQNLNNSHPCQALGSIKPCPDFLSETLPGLRQCRGLQEAWPTGFWGSAEEYDSWWCTLTKGFYIIAHLRGNVTDKVTGWRQ